MRRESNIQASALSAPPREKKSGWQIKRIDPIPINMDSRRVPIANGVRDGGEYP
jgi:hypothetical protein